MTDENLPACAGPTSQDQGVEQLQSVNKAITSCQRSGNDPSDHFAHARKVILLNKERQEAIDACHPVRSDAARRLPICPYGHTTNAIGGTMPESLLPAELIQQVQKRLKDSSPRLKLDGPDAKGLKGPTKKPTYG